MLYLFAVIFSAVMILIAAGISYLIQFELVSNPRDVRKRKIWFWVLAVLTPPLFYVLGLLLIAPDRADDPMIYDAFMTSLMISTGISLVAYIVFGFILSKIFKHGKIGNWI